MHKISVGGYLIPVPDIEDLEEINTENKENSEKSLPYKEESEADADDT